MFYKVRGCEQQLNPSTTHPRVHTLLCNVDVNKITFLRTLHVTQLKR